MLAIDVQRNDMGHADCSMPTFVATTIINDEFGNQQQVVAGRVCVAQHSTHVTSIFHLHVEDEFRGQSVSTQLIRYLLREVIQTPLVIAGCLDDHKRLKDMYKKEGFEEVATFVSPLTDKMVTSFVKKNVNSALKDVTTLSTQQQPTRALGEGEDTSESEKDVNVETSSVPIPVEHNEDEEA